MKKTFVALLVALTLSLALTASAQGPGSWTEYLGNPIFGKCKGDPNAYYPSILYDANNFLGRGDSVKYKMWYGTSGSKTRLATSDNGIDWTDQGFVIWDGYHTTVEYYPDGFLGSNKGDTTSADSMYYRMWYWDYPTIYSVTAIRYTESPDGENWYNYQSCQNDSIVPIITGVYPDWNRGSYGPCDILYDSTAEDTLTDWTFIMYYDGTAGADERIGLGFSSDGIKWKGYDANGDSTADYVFQGTYQSTWDTNYVSRATIIKESDTDYKMWYSGGKMSMNHGIGYATSSDGINWTRPSRDSIFYKDDGVAWRDERTYCPAVLKDGNSYKMWFAGREDMSDYYCIGYAWTTPPDSNLSAYWKLNESSGTIAYDASGNSHNATLINCPVWKPEDGGYIDGALQFDGYNDLVEIAAQADSGFLHDSFSERTVAMWINANSTSGTHVLFDEGGHIKGLAIRIISNNLQAAVINGSGTRVQLSNSFTSTDWSHVAAVFDSGSFKLYINGTQVKSTTAGYTSVGNHANQAGLGDINNTCAFGFFESTPFPGLIDDVRVYNVALSGTDVQDLANALKAPTNLSATLNNLKIDLSWKDNSNDEIGFKIERKVDNSTYNQINVVGPDDTTYSDTNLSSPATYTYRVRAYNSIGNSIYSNEDSATVAEGSGPEAYWRLDEAEGGTAHDLSGNCHDAILKNGPVWQPDSGYVDGALKFDGSDDYVELAGDSSSGFLHDQFYERTVSMWINANSTSGSQVLFEEGSSDTCLAVRINGDTLQAAVQNGADSTKFTLSTSFTSTDWSHVTVVFDSGAFKLFKNGTLADSTNAGYSSVYIHYDKAGLGGCNGECVFGCTGNYFAGLIDEVRIYESALSNEEVADELLPPGNLNATSVSSSQINLSWTDNTDNEDGFKIERMGPDSTYKQIYMAYSNDTSYSDKNLSGPAKYKYRVRAYNNTYNSIYSYEDSANVSGRVPEAYWMLDESSGTTAYDSSGNGHDAILKNGPVWQPTGGIIDGALQFDGVNDYLELAPDTCCGFLHDSFSERTVAMWINADSTSLMRVLYDEGHATTGLAIRIYNNNLEAAVRDSSNVTQVALSTSFNSTDWSHIAVVFDKGDFKMYVDGTQVDAKTAVYSSVRAHSTPAILGYKDGGTAFGWFEGTPFPGLIDEVRIYNDALSDEEIETLAAFGLYKLSEKINDLEQTLPKKFALLQNYPNPFNPSTKILFQLPESRPVELKIFNVLGREVCTLIDKQYEAGYHNVVWDGKDKNGNFVSGGLYIYRIKAGDFIDVKKMILLK